MAAMTFVDAPEFPGNDESATTRLRTGFVRQQSVITKIAQLLHYRVGHDEGRGPGDGSGTIGRRYALPAALQGKTEARVENHDPPRRGKPAQDDQIGM